MTLDEYRSTYGEHHAQSVAIAAAMRAASPQLAARAQRMEACGTIVDGYVCPDCGEYHVTHTSLCRDRLCPNCGWLLTRRRGGQALAALEALNEVVPVEVLHLVLTVDHTRKSDLRGLLRSLTQGYGKLMRTPDVRERVLGSFRSVEITHSDRNGFHPHVHALLASPAGERPLDAPTLQAAWREALDVDYDPEVSCTPAYARAEHEADTWQQACLEAVKYAIKPGFLPTLDVGTMQTVADAIKGARLCSSDGALRLAAHPPACERPDPASRGACSHCASTERERRVWMRWQHDAAAFESSPYPRYM